MDGHYTLCRLAHAINAIFKKIMSLTNLSLFLLLDSLVTVLFCLFMRYQFRIDVKINFKYMLFNKNKIARYWDVEKWYKYLKRWNRTSEFWNPVLEIGLVSE